VCVTTIEYHSMGNGNYAVVNEQNSRDDDEADESSAHAEHKTDTNFFGFKRSRNGESSFDYECLVVY
jgi:hypothetical protein